MGAWCLCEYGYLVFVSEQFWLLLYQILMEVLILRSVCFHW